MRRFLHPILASASCIRYLLKCDLLFNQATAISDSRLDTFFVNTTHCLLSWSFSFETYMHSIGYSFYLWSDEMWIDHVGSNECIAISAVLLWRLWWPRKTHLELSGALSRAALRVRYVLAKLGLKFQYFPLLTSTLKRNYISNSALCMGARAFSWLKRSQASGGHAPMKWIQAVLSYVVLEASALSHGNLSVSVRSKIGF
jgi:hypothetical protein